MKSVVTLVLFVLLALTQAQELDVNQQRNLKSATAQIERAEKASDVNTIENSLRNARRYLDLLEDAAGNEQVKALKARYDALQEKAKWIRSGNELVSTFNGLLGKIKRYKDPAKVPDSEKKIMAEQLVQIEKCIVLLRSSGRKEFAEPIRKVEELLPKLRQFIGDQPKPENPKTDGDQPKPENPKVDSPKPPVSKEISKEEKEALSRLKSIFGFCKRYMEEGRKHQKDIQAGQNVSAGRIQDTTVKLDQYAKSVEPHVQVLSQNAERHAETIKACQELKELSESLSQSLAALKEKEKNEGAQEALRYFEDYLGKAGQALDGFRKKIEASNNPKETIRDITSGLDFNLGKAADQLSDAQRRYSEHPLVVDAAKRLAEMQEKAKAAQGDIQRLGVVQQARLLWINAKVLVKKMEVKPDDHYPNSNLKEAAKLYASLVAYLHANKNLEEIAKVLPNAEAEQRECRKLQVKDACEATLRAVERGYFGFIATNIAAAHEMAAADNEFNKLVCDYEMTILHAACKKAVKAQEEQSRDELDAWHGQYWKYIVAAAGKPELAKIVDEYAAGMVKKQLDYALKAIESQDAEPKQQIADYDKFRSNAQALIAKNAALAKLEEPYQAKFTALRAQAEERLQKKLKEIAEAERRALEEFEKGLSPEQRVVFIEWGKKYPARKEEDKGQLRWVFVQPDTDFEADTHHHYLFDNSGKLMGKEAIKVGGGRVYGYRLGSSSWTEIVNVKKDGKIYGYRGESSWTNIAEIRENGKIYGYTGDSSWGELGEIKENGEVHGYYRSSPDSTSMSWGHFADIKENGEIRGYYRSSSDSTSYSWGHFADIKENGEIRGYYPSSSGSYSWCHFADIKIASPDYRRKVAVFIVCAFQHR